MNKTRFYELLERPNELDDASLGALTEIAVDFPWFQAGRMLLVKNLHQLDHVRFNAELKLAAVHVSNRKRLYELIHKYEPVVVEEVAEEKSEAKVVPEVLIETVEALENEVVNTPDDQAVESGPSVKMTAEVRSVADYFQTDDVYESPDGTSIDFGGFSMAETDKGEDLVFPSADLLGYDGNEYVSYQLKEAVEMTELTEGNKSFSDWLSALRHAPVAEQKAENEPPKKKSQQLIDNFLNVDSPRIIRPSGAVSGEENVRHQKSLNENDDLMSETLAGIYIKQKHYHKAMAIYEKLRLKYPEKNVYFAERISDLENLINNQ